MLPIAADNWGGGCAPTGSKMRGWRNKVSYNELYVEPLGVLTNIENFC